MENSTENVNCTEKLGDLSQDETLTDQENKEDISNEAATVTELEELESLDEIEQADEQAECEELQEVKPVVTPGCTENLEEISMIKSDLAQVSNGVNGIKETTSKIANEIREIHKLYHNEFANRLQSMQEELERYREVEKGRIFDGILGEIAKLYSDNEAVVDDITDEKAKKRLRYMFLDMLQVLENSGVFKQKSAPGDKRNTRHCQVVERVPTDNPELHDTVVTSRSVGFYIENRSLVKELVDVYIYTKKADDKSV